MVTLSFIFRVGLFIMLLALVLLTPGVKRIIMGRVEWINDPAGFFVRRMLHFFHKIDGISFLRRDINIAYKRTIAEIKKFRGRYNVFVRRGGFPNREAKGILYTLSIVLSEDVVWTLREDGSIAWGETNWVEEINDQLKDLDPPVEIEISSTRYRLTSSAFDEPVTIGYEGVGRDRKARGLRWVQWSERLPYQYPENNPPLLDRVISGVILHEWGYILAWWLAAALVAYFFSSAYLTALLLSWIPFLLLTGVYWFIKYPKPKKT